MGAAGRTGRRIASLLVARGRPVRAVVRRADDLRSLELLGA
ncbi:NAD(P)H-binding protein [Streptomyces sp. NPDC002668]